MTGYVFEHFGKQFDPNGSVQVANADDHNKAIESAELANWANGPSRHAVYVTKARVGAPVTTWLGTPLGVITRVNRFSTNISCNMVSIRFQGTNGKIYSGRFGADWSQLCRVRQVSAA